MPSGDIEMCCAAEVSRTRMYIRLPGWALSLSSLVLRLSLGVVGTDKGTPPGVGTFWRYCYTEDFWFIPLLGMPLNATLYGMGCLCLSCCFPLPSEHIIPHQHFLPLLEVLLPVFQPSASDRAKVSYCWSDATSPGGPLVWK